MNENSLRLTKTDSVNRSFTEVWKIDLPSKGTSFGIQLDGELYVKNEKDEVIWTSNFVFDKTKNNSSYVFISNSGQLVVSKIENDSTLWAK